MAGLVKPPERVLVSPAVQAVAGNAPVAFRMYAPPTPPGIRYRQIAPDLPNSLSTMAGWSPIAEVPSATPADSPFYGKTYLSSTELSAWLNAHNLSSISMPPGWSVVINSGTGAIVGYTAPAPGTTEYMAWQAWLGNGAPDVFGPIIHMQYVRFDDVATEANGYPKGAGPFVGYVDVPNPSGGLTRVTGVYRKYLTNGVLYRESGDAAPAYTQFKTGYGILVMSGFPGAPAIAAKPAQYTLDPRLGWNAGANSINSFDGNVRTTFQVDVKAAAAVGIYHGATRDQGAPESLDHAFYFDFSGASMRWRVIERGVARTQAYPFSSASVFKIERVAGAVTYFIDNVQVYVNQAAVRGAVRVGAALFSADDKVI